MRYVLGSLWLLALAADTFAREITPYEVTFSVANLQGGRNGEFTVKVHPRWSPLGAGRFRALFEQRFFDDVRFFRVISGFMAQFGISGDATISRYWKSQTLADDPVRVSNLRGRLSFATSGKNSRTTQIFINFVDNKFLDSMGFSPFAEVVTGMDVVDQLYAGYGEGAPSGRGPSQGRIQGEGNVYLRAEFPKLSYINHVSLGGASANHTELAAGTEQSFSLSTWSPGIPALIALVMTSLIGVLLGHFMLPVLFDKDTTSVLQIPSRDVVRHAIVVATVAGVFWAWAIWNCLKRFDLGAFSFAFVIAAAAYACSTGLHAASYPGMARLNSFFVPAGCLCVAANYFLGCVLGFLWHAKPTLIFYFTVAGIWWVAAGLSGLTYAKRLLADVQSVTNPVELDEADVLGHSRDGL